MQHRIDASSESALPTYSSPDGPQHASQCLPRPSGPSVLLMFHLGVTPSLAYGTHDVQLGQPVRLCPPPPHIVAPDVLASVQERAEVVARQLGLSGYACLEGFMNADTGSLTVMEVTTLPALDSSSTFLTQVNVLLRQTST